MQSIFSFTIFIVAFHISFEQLIVYHPQSLAEKLNGNFIYTIANFGKIPYGHSINGQIRFLLNESNKEQNNYTNYGCDQKEMEDLNKKSDNSVNRHILFIDRGQCAFLKKAYIAESLGAVMLIIGDNQDENVTQQIMIGDNSGQHVNIPVIMISNNDSNLIKNEFRNGDYVEIKIHFQHPNQDKIANIEFWMNSMDRESYEFITTFKEHMRELNGYYKFDIHYPLWYCYTCKLSNWSSNTESCLSGGRYCAPDPDGSGPLTGQQAIREDIRQLCIFKNSQQQWWNYMEYLGKKCFQENQDVQACIKQAEIQAGINTIQLQECYQKSFEGKDEGLNDNIILRQERQYMMEQGIQYWPLLIVNNNTFRGDLQNTQAVFEYICESLLQEPNACKQYDNLEDIDTEQQIDQEKSYTWIYILVIVLSLVVIVIFLLIYRRIMRAELQKTMQIQVNESISKYFALVEKNNAPSKKEQTSKGSSDSGISSSDV